MTLVKKKKIKKGKKWKNKNSTLYKKKLKIIEEIENIIKKKERKPLQYFIQKIMEIQTFEPLILNNGEGIII
jgi:uncharacterized phage-like protein YoqJ